VSTDSEPGVRDGRSRFIHLDAGQRRSRDANVGTMVMVFDAPYSVSTPFEALFVAHYRAIRAIGRSASGAGVAVVAVHVPTCSLAARAWLGARPGAVRSAILGRHSEVDVLLDAPALSLRHLALLVPPPASWDAGAVTYEVVDLRTQQSFQDERGRPLEGAQAEGPAFFTCGPYALFFLPTGDPSDWPELATDAWAMLPERVLVRERAAEPDRWRRRGYAARQEVEDAGRSRSVITAIPAPLGVGEPLVAEGESPAGALRITSERGTRRLAVGKEALARGVLLGRYSRCDASDVLGHDHISRAHLLVKRVGDEIVAVDTASTTGTYLEGGEHTVRTVALGRGEVAVLGDDRARVRWEPAER